MVYDAANRLTQWGTTPLTYDNNGNLTSDGTNTYTWNARNQLASMTGANFVYDGLGRRQKKIIGASTTEFLYDRVNPVLLLGAPPVSILGGLGIDEFFMRTEGANAGNFLTDVLGSTVALTDSAGTVQTEYTYEPFGKATVTGAASTNSFQFTGRENDGTGLYYYRARYYHPTFQRFISEDPIKFFGGNVNLYAYVRNNPLRYTDPLGLIDGPTCGVGLPNTRDSDSGFPPPPPPGSGRKDPSPPSPSPGPQPGPSPVSAGRPGPGPDPGCMGMCRAQYFILCSLLCEPLIHVNPVAWFWCNVACVAASESSCDSRCTRR